MLTSNYTGSTKPSLYNDAVMLNDLSRDELISRERALLERFAIHKEAGLALDLTRGKPSPEQLSLSDELDAMVGGEFRASDGTDLRNYGGLTGMSEARELGAELLGIGAEDVIAGGNSSLTLMYQYLLHAWLHGPLDTKTAWRLEPGPTKFLCVVPGYDRHFTIVENLGFELLNVRLTDSGPDMDQIEDLVSSDPSIKGIWCVPKYSNPTGHVYADNTVKRLAHIPKIAGPNFRIMWDNAYAVHDFDDNPPVLANIFSHCETAGTKDSVIQFASTSKVTRAGAGISFLAASQANRDSFIKTLGIQTIGPDKLNQLRHVRFLKNIDGIRVLMRGHAAIVKPKFDLVVQHLTDGLTSDSIGSWTTPRGGYFLSFEAPKGLATEIVRLSAEAGVKLTPAGATFPHGQDPNNSNIRIAPTYPSLDEIDQAMPVFVTAVSLAAVRKLLQSSEKHA
jgi:DNA-binding transcriptional MocR family regulator|tara:strand:+ start:488 stop:1837 length:1350 start_codon:yes stop_codon:yes gene_type:complete